MCGFIEGEVKAVGCSCSCLEGLGLRQLEEKGSEEHIFPMCHAFRTVFVRQTVCVIATKWVSQKVESSFGNHSCSNLKKVIEDIYSRSRNKGILTPVARGIN